MTISNARRAFLKQTLLVSAGAAAGSFGTLALEGTGPAAAQEAPAGDPERRLRDLGITLPPPLPPVAIYIPAVRVGNMLFTSGHGPRHPDGSFVAGKVGRDLTLEEGAAAARIVGLNVLSTVRHTLGSLDQVVRLVKVLGMVNCTPDFTEQPRVINGFSELMVEVFGEKHGKAARSAVGMGSLPSNIPVEIEAVFEVRG